MKWSDDYATGVQSIDEQHKMIFKMADDYRDALDAGEGKKTYDLLLDFLDHYCRAHFAFEERCMEEYRCAVAQRNKDAHSKFVDVCRGFRQRYTTSGWQAADARELVDTVDRWLAHHICGIDVHLKDYVGESPPGSSGSLT
jgi:hemerythrin